MRKKIIILRRKSTVPRFYHHPVYRDNVLATPSENNKENKEMYEYMFCYNEILNSKMFKSKPLNIWTPQKNTVFVIKISKRY